MMLNDDDGDDNGGGEYGDTFLCLLLSLARGGTGVSSFILSSVKVVASIN